MRLKAFYLPVIALCLSACNAEGFDAQVDQHVQAWALQNGCAKVENFKRTQIVKGDVGKNETGKPYRNRFESVVADYSFDCVKADQSKESMTASTLMYRNTSTAEKFGQVVKGEDKKIIEDLKVTTDFKNS